MRLSWAALVASLTVGAGGIGAWYGWTARLQVLEERMTASSSRIDNLLRDVQEHHGLPGHAVVMHITDELDRRLKIVEGLIGKVDPLTEQRWALLMQKLDAIEARVLRMEQKERR